MRVEILNWVKLVTIAWPVIIFVATVMFLVIFFRPLRRILDRFDSEDIQRFKFGPIEIVKRVRPKRGQNRRRKDRLE